MARSSIIPNSGYKIIHGDCLDAMKLIPVNSIHSIVSDPPYGLQFMNSFWDYEVPDRRYWRECLRIAKPGAFLLAFGGTRCFHRLVCAIEDVGWEIRDCLMWLYGEGFPKSHNVSKAIDDLFGAEREVIKRTGQRCGVFAHSGSGVPQNIYDYEAVITKPATKEAKQWDGWGSALKPAWEPIIVARKPFKGSLAQNILKHGVGALNISGCRIGIEKLSAQKSGSTRIYNNHISVTPERIGRWPANLILDEEAAIILDKQSGYSKSSDRVRHNRIDNHIRFISPNDSYGYSDEGGASRFFYIAKASRSERELGMGSRKKGRWSDGRKKRIDNAYQRGKSERGNTHVTVKPINLMRWLVRLVTPMNGICLDPFCGSGSTVAAAIEEDTRSIGIELSDDSYDIAIHRLNAIIAKLELARLS